MPASAPTACLPNSCCTRLPPCRRARRRSFTRCFSQPPNQHMVAESGAQRYRGRKVRVLCFHLHVALPRYTHSSLCSCEIARSEVRRGLLVSPPRQQRCRWREILNSIVDGEAFSSNLADDRLGPQFFKRFRKLQHLLLAILHDYTHPSSSRQMQGFLLLGTLQAVMSPAASVNQRVVGSSPV